MEKDIKKMDTASRTMNHAALLCDDAIVLLLMSAEALSGIVYLGDVAVNTNTTRYFTGCLV